MGKVQYRLLAIVFACFVTGIAVLSVSVHYTLGNLMRAEIKSSLDTIYSFKSQYLKSWMAAERESLDGVYFSATILDELYSFSKSSHNEELEYIDQLNRMRRQVLNSVNDSVAEVSILSPHGDVLVSSNLELLKQVHPSWQKILDDKVRELSGDTWALMNLDERLSITLIRSLYRDGDVFAFAILEKDLPNQYLFDFVKQQSAHYQVYLYEKDLSTFLLSYQQQGKLLQFRASNAFNEKLNYWLNESGWAPIESGQDMVGVWGWDEELGLGMAVLGNSHQAFRTLSIIQSINLGFLLCILVASAIIAWFFKEYRKHRLALEHQLEEAIELQAQDLSNERQEKQSLVEALFQNSSDGYLVISKDRVIDTNPAAAHMLGLKDKNGLLGKSPFAYSPSFQINGEESLELAEEILEKVFESGFERFEWEFETKNKTKIACLITITIVRYHGENVGIMVWQNMTQAVESEKELRESERKNRAILNATSHMLFVLDSVGNMIDLNSAAAEWLKKNRKESLGISFWEAADWLMDPVLMEVTKNAFDSASKGETVKFESDIYITEDKHFFDFVLTPIFDEFSQLVMVIMEVYDISIIRNAEIAEKEARQLAEEISQTKTNFLANMSHEIRTPMNAIIGLTKLCLKTALDGRQRTMLESIDQASETLLNILNDILDFSKVESGKLEIELVTFSINDVLQTVSGLFGLKAEEKNIEFVVGNKAGALNVIGDPLRIQQVLMNLCSNAIKFTENGEVLLSVEMIQKTHDRGVFRFLVKDTGIGLTEDQKSRLFEAFSQADTSTTRRFGGTGLGLAISKELVELMGGTLTVESEAGEGSVFYFDLPLALLDDADDPFENALPQATKRIGIVDDNLVCVEVEKKIVSKLGYEPVVFSSGEAVLEYIKSSSKSMDVILMDWDMPGLDGCEVALRIKQNLEERSPAIVLVTGVSNELSPERIEQYGLDGFVIKPVNPDVLSHVIDEAFQKRHSWVSRAAVDTSKPKLTQSSNAAKILIVEDNDINQMVVKNFLLETGLDPFVVSNGKEALDYVLEHGPEIDAVLMDLQMPVMDGFTATEKIREHFDAETLPILAMTANVLTADREKAKALGMNDMIAKPIDFEAFEWILGQWVELPHSFVEKLEPNATDLNQVSIDGVDFSFGLNQLGQDEALYLSMLIKFQEDFLPLLEQMEVALESNDMDQLENVSHKLKGVAGNLGFTKLKQLLHELENAAARKKANESQVVVVREIWPSLNSAIEQAKLALNDETGVLDITASAESLVNELNLIADRLTQHEVLPMDEVRELKQKLTNYVEVSEVNQFVRAIESFQTDQALDLLVTFVEQLIEQNPS